MKKPTVVVPERCEEQKDKRRGERERDLLFASTKANHCLQQQKLPTMHLRFYEGNV